MKNSKKLVAVLLAAVLTFVCVGCGNTDAKENDTNTTAQETEANSSEPIKIAVTAWNPNMFMRLAEELGYFEEAGVNVELVDFVEFSDVPAAFNAGQLDGAFFSSFEVISPSSQGVDMKIVAIVDNSVGADALIAANEYSTLESLKGKKIGVGFDTVSHIFLMLLLEENGYSLDDFELIDMGASARANALVTGDIDATAIFEPFISSTMASDPSIQVIADTSAYPTMINDCIAFSGSVLENRKEDVVKIMNCWYKAMKYWEENTEEATDIMAKQLDTTSEDFTETMKKLHMVDAESSLEQMTSSGEGSWTDSVSMMVDFLMEREMIESKVEVADMLDTSILEQVTE